MKKKCPLYRTLIIEGCYDENGDEENNSALSAGLATLERDNAQLRAIISMMDAKAPRADDSCWGPGISYSEATRRQLTDDEHPLFKDGG